MCYIQLAYAAAIAASAYSANEQHRLAKKPAPALPSNPAPTADAVVNPEQVAEDAGLLDKTTRRSLRVDLVSPGSRLSKASGATVPNTGLQVRTGGGPSGIIGTRG